MGRACNAPSRNVHSFPSRGRTPAAVPLGGLALAILALGMGGCQCDGAVQKLTAQVRGDADALSITGPVGVTTTRSLEVSSTGTGPATLRAIRIEGPDADLFVAPPLPDPAVLAARASTALEVGFHPAVEGRYEARLIVESSDPDSPLEVALTGIAQAPDIAVCRTEADGGACAPADGCLTVDFGRALHSQSVARTLLVRNDGRARLTVFEVRLDPGTEAAGFSVDRDLTGEGLPAPSAVEVGLHFFGKDQGPVTRRLTFVTNDPDQPEACVELVGEGAPNQAPLACAGVQEIIHQGGDHEIPADPSAPLARPLDRLFLTAHPEAACSADAEDADADLGYAWTLLSRPERSGAAIRRPDEGGPPFGDPPDALTSPYLDVDAVGEYVLGLTVTDRQGASGTTELVVDAIPKDDITVELSWTEPADLDAHLIAPGGTPFCATLDCYWNTCMAGAANGQSVLDWGPDTTGDGLPDPDGVESDNPIYVLDNVGSTILSGTTDVRLENIRLPRAPEVTGGRYAVAVHYFEDKGVAADGVEATIKVVYRGQILFESTHTFAKDAVGELWIAGDVDIVAGTGRVLDQVESRPGNGDPVDCQP